MRKLRRKAIWQKTCKGGERDVQRMRGKTEEAKGREKEERRMGRRGKTGRGGRGRKKLGKKHTRQECWE